ncbi:MAG: phosphoribosylaminoimidazolecarboxamide formyltransferase [Candidatus Latescibacterota bacterium]|nr:phosphoribosylaminoimidazolecarboxamide formyltransferase [Candidatus Latescibacterota bacterium]
MSMSNELSMRYGCNPHQSPARCVSSKDLPIEALNDAPSYINLMDALNSWQLVRELKQAMNLPAAASFKHVSPAGAAVGVPLSDELRQSLFVRQDDLSPLACAYARARGADRMASFGDWIALSDPVDVSTAELIRVEMSDGVIAPEYEEGALEILKQKKGGKYRVVKIDPDYEPDPIERRQIFGLDLEQHRNDFVPDDSFFDNVVTQRKQLTAEAIRDLTVATIGVKYTQSNSVVLAVDGQLVGVGAGQQSRIHCVRLAADKADRWYLRQHPAVREIRFAKGLKRPDRDNAIDLFFEDELTPAEQEAWRACFRTVPERLSAADRRAWLDGIKGVALSSDAFFPFRDNIDRASRSGVEFVVEPGGSLGDETVIAAADEYGMAVVFSGLRLFHH